MKHIITVKEALIRAQKYGLIWEVQNELNHGCSPWTALYEWDLLNENEI